MANFSTIFVSVVDTGGLPVSTTPVANCHRYQRRRRQICHRCLWHRWQIMATISGCRHLKVNLKAKIYIYVNSTTQRCPNKIIKIFLLEGYFHLPPVSLTPVANLELRISPQIFEKIRNGTNGIIRGLGEKNQKQKSRDTVPLNTYRWGFPESTNWLVEDQAFSLSPQQVFLFFSFFLCVAGRAYRQKSGREGVWRS